jgi:hypothetical protein
VQVIGHDREQLDVQGAANHGLTELSQEPMLVDVVADNFLPAVAAGHDTIDRLRVLKAQSSWHGPNRNILSIGSQEKT